MQINPSEIAYKKQVGQIETSPVYEVGLKGGLHLIMAVRKGRVETLGVGPHRAVARHIAKKKDDKVEWTELAKADEPRYKDYAYCVPRYEAITNFAREYQGSK